MTSSTAGTHARLRNAAHLSFMGTAAPEVILLENGATRTLHRDGKTGEFIDDPNKTVDGDFGGVTFDATSVEAEPEYEYNHGYHFKAHFLPEAIRKVEQANEKLAKLGIDDRFAWTTETYVTTDNGQRHEMIRFELDRPAIGYDGYVFAGAHDFTPTGATVSHLTRNGAISDLIPADNHCDHCGSKRARGRVYTVTHPEKGTIQVGQSCLAAYMGIKPEGLWALDDDLGMEGLEESSRINGRENSNVWDVDELLVAALTATNNGKEYVSTTAAGFMGVGTAVKVRQDFRTLLAEGDGTTRRRLARKIVAWTKKLDGEPGSYEGNLKAILGGKQKENYVRNQHFGIAVSAVSAYNRAIERQKEQAARQKLDAANPVKQEYLAEPGEKLAGVEATVVSVKTICMQSFSYPYNDEYKPMVTMRTADGHTLLWVAPSSYDGKLEESQQVRIKGAIVKSNKVYQDVWQTGLKNVRLDPTV